MQVAMNDVTRVELTPIRSLTPSPQSLLVRELKVHGQDGDLTVTLYAPYNQSDGLMLVAPGCLEDDE